MNQSIGYDIKALFNACVDLPESEQINFIATSNYSDDVKQQVLKLLNYSGDIDVAMSKVILDTAQQGLNSEPIIAGEMIDQYKLIKKVGEGGQGEVWLAARGDGDFNHQVAIKFIKLSPTEKELQRFQNERELLASLQHPNISALIGGGQYNDRLYMVMEWVDGVPLLSYLDHCQQNLKDTFKFFLQICQAVSYAHSKGIIHRDIKPSNIMVTSAGLVKLLDFGIAKPFDAELTQTQSEAMMTFAYSSPEQIKGQSVTTATDVYALGLVLYEMLTAHMAQERTTESPAELIHTITDVTPLKPSVQVAAISDKKKKFFPAKVLKGDLDNLVMMAIRKEADRRYSNADELIKDVNNYLLSMPLIASGDSAFYKVGKLLKRNPLASMLSAAVLGFLIILPVLMYQNSIELKQQRDKAEEQVLIANKTTGFLTTLFQASSPLGHGGQPVDLNSVMEQGERLLNLDDGQKPQVVAALSNEFAQIYHHLENTSKAIAYYQKAISSYRQAGDQSGLLAAQGQLALMYFRNDQLDKSDEMFIQADETASLQPNTREAVLHYTRKATVETERGERQKAAEIIEQVFNNLTDENHQDIEVMSRIYHVWGEAIKFSDKERALEFAKKSMEHEKQQVGSVHPFYLKRINSLATKLRRLNRHKEAGIVLDEVLKVSEALYSEDHPEYASMLSGKGDYLHDLGYFMEAEKVYVKALETYRKYYGENNFQTARMINNLAYLYEDMHLYDKAKPLYQRSVELRHELDPQNTIRVATSKANLARLLSKLSDYQQSMILLNELMPIYESHNRNNLYNEITLFANLVGSGDSDDNCESALTQLQAIEPRLQKESAEGWRRLGAEVWISELLKTCKYEQLAMQWLLAADEKSIHVYQSDSEGLKYIQDRISEEQLN